MTGEPVPFFDARAATGRLRFALEARLRAVLDHGRFILGPEVAELEAALCAWTGAAHAVGVASGTDALVIALTEAGIGPGDAVFVPAFTFVATAGAVVAVGAEPVFCDVDPRTFTLDPDDLGHRIDRVARAGRLRPRAVIPVDLFGLPADYAAVGRVARGHDLFVLADAAQSLGARRDGLVVGRLAPVTAVSFFPTKPLGGFGDGGALLTDDPGRARRFRSIRGHGLDADGRVIRHGINGRLDTLQAALLLARLPSLGGDLARRAAIARRYDAALAGRALLPVPPPETDGAHSVYSLLCDNRDGTRERLKAHGVETRVYYDTPLHLQPALRRFGDGPGSLPVAERLAREILSLPLHPDLDDAAVERVCAACAACLP